MFKILFRVFAILFFFIYIYRGNIFTHDKFLHYPAKELILDSYDNLTNHYKQGSYYHRDSLSLDEKLFRKKINNFLFLTENKRKIEIALIDLNFASAINVNYFGENRTHSFERQFGFSLSQDFNDHSLTIKNSAHQRIFEYNSEEKVINDKQTVVSYFKVKEINGKSTFQLTLTHYQPLDRCLTFLRDGVISFKCYGGKAQGQYFIMIKEFGVSTFFQEKQKLQLESSTAAFDGFRASGFKWYWIWGMGSGINQKGQHISINFGSIRDIGEDFLYINNYTIPIKAIQYELNENKTVGDLFTFKSAQPPMQLTFQITAKQHKYKDMFLLKNDMVKFQGYWSGRFQDPIMSQVYQFQRFAGLVQTADSIF